MFVHTSEQHNSSVVILDSFFIGNVSILENCLV